MVADEEEGDDGEGADDGLAADDEAEVESEEPAAEGGATVSPYVWYSAGGVAALVAGYFACCKKSDDGYSRIQ